MSHSQSKANTTQSTSTADNRQVVDGGSIGLSNSSGNNISVLDSGVTKAAIELAGNVADGGLAGLKMVLAFASKVNDGGSKTLERQAVSISEAYKDSKGPGLQQNVLVIGALAAVAVIAFARA